MKRYRVSRDAESDLDDIFTYWAERASLEIADKLVDAIAERFWIIGEYPNFGKECGEIEPGVRCFPAGQYLIYYRKLRRGVEIAHLFHGARDQRRAWKESKR